MYVLYKGTCYMLYYKGPKVRVCEPTVEERAMHLDTSDVGLVYDLKFNIVQWLMSVTSFLSVRHVSLRSTQMHRGGCHLVAEQRP